MKISQKPEPIRSSEKTNSALAIPVMTTGLRKKYKLLLLAGLTLAGIAAAFLVPPISQDPHYHTFADTRTFFGIPNCWNVLSNLPFLLVGLVGMVAIGRKKPAGMYPALTAGYFIFFAGIFFTGFGSAYYHLNPGNATLLWDRLPMTIAFMAFFAIIIGEFISLAAGRRLLLPLLLTGIGSVLYWHFTEAAGHGDLRFYALVQFLPIMLIPVIMLLFQSGTNTNFYTWLVVLAYLLAKIFETYDEPIFHFTGQLSGHTLKHLLAALAPLIFLLGLFKRNLTSQPD